MNDFELLDLLTIASFIMQLQTQQSLSQQATNDDVMKELHKQDRSYLEVIIAQNTKIISLLENLLGDSSEST